MWRLQSYHQPISEEQSICYPQCTGSLCNSSRRKFTRLGLKQAYLQMEVEPESQPYLTINTRKGLFTFKRTPFWYSNYSKHMASNLTELKSFLGLLNYYNHFLPNLSDTLQPLHQLLQAGKKWVWTQPETGLHSC